MKRRFPRQVLLIMIPLAVLVCGYTVWWLTGWLAPDYDALRVWFERPAERAALITNNARCPDAPFMLPSAGFVGLLWNDPRGIWTPVNPHSGLDIFGDGEPGQVPVVATYDGYLTREENWVSAVIIRHPDDPLNPGQPVWTYYAHMASVDGATSYILFSPGTREMWVEQGQLIGYQGLYNGGSDRQIGLHVHFSIVRGDGDTYSNETLFRNTLDPSPYTGMPLNHGGQPALPVRCNSG